MWKKAEQTAPISPSQIPLRQGAARVEIATTVDALSPYAAAWDRLALESPQHLPMLSHAWVASYFEHLVRPNMRWACLFAFERDALIGVMPVEFRSNRTAGLLPVRLAIPVSAHTHSVDLVLQKDRERDAAALLIKALAVLNPRWGRIRLTTIPHRSPTVGMTRAGLPGIRGLVTEEGFGDYVSITGTYQQYLDTLSENTARNLRRRHDKYRQLGSVCERFIGAGAVQPEHLIQFLDVEASGWKAAAGTAIKQSPQLVSFYHALASRLDALGWLEYHFLDAEGKAIAAHLGVRMGRTLVLLKIAYDEQYSSCAPGNILMARTIEHAFTERDTDEINCLTDMPWHRKWSMRTRPYYDIVWHRNSPVPLVTGYLPARARHAAAHIPGLPALFHWLRHDRTIRH